MSASGEYGGRAALLTPSRRAFAAGVAAFVAAPGVVQAQRGRPPEIARLEAALRQAQARNDMFEVVKTRVTLAIELRGPFFGQTPADWARARSLLEANSAPAIQRVTAGGWGLSRLYLAEMMLDERRPKRMAELALASQAAADARSVLPPTSGVALRICIAGLTTAILRRDLAGATAWFNQGVGAVPRSAPPVSADYTDDERYGLHLADMTTLFALGARLAALKGDAPTAWRWLEASKRTSPDAARAANPQALPDTAASARDAAQLLRRFDAVVGIVVTPAGSSLLIHAKTPRGPTSLIRELATNGGPMFDTEEMETLLWGSLWRETFMRGALGGWNGAYGADDGRGGPSSGETFKRELEKLTKTFWVYYAGQIQGALSQAGVADGGRVALVQPTDLAKLPIRSATHPTTGKSLIDHYAIAEGPDLATLLAARDLPRQPPRMVGLFNPTGDLVGADAEFVLQRTLFGAAASQRLQSGIRARDLITTVQRSGAQYFYLATHGGFGFTGAAPSGISLGNNSLLSVRDIAAAPARLDVTLAVLSACETSKTSENLLRTPSSLPNGLLAKGVRGVVGALWKVEDWSTAILMHRMMEFHLTDGLDPARALTAAQKFLRDATAQSLGAHVQAALATAPQEDRNRLGNLLVTLADLPPNVRPYAHPYYWASFAYYGV